MPFSAPSQISSFAAVEEIIAVAAGGQPFILVVKTHIGSPRREIETFTVAEVLAGTPDPTRVEVLDQTFTNVGSIFTSGTSVRLYWNDRANPVAPVIRQVDFDLATNVAGSVSTLPFIGIDPFPMDARTATNPNRFILVYALPNGANVFRVSDDLGATWGVERIADPPGSNVALVEGNFDDPQGLRQDVQTLQRRVSGVSSDAFLSAFTTFIPPTTINLLPAQDTFRGGAFIVVLNANLLDTSRDVPLTSAPTGWTPANDVSFERRRGARLRSVTSDATLTSPTSDYVYFDVSVDVEPLSPPDSAPAPAYIACLEHTAGGQTMRVCLVRGFSNDTTQLFGVGEAFAADPAGGVESPATSKVTLRLVRNGPRVYGFIGTREGTAEGFTTLIKVLDAPVESVGTTPGSIVLASRRGTSGRTTEAVFSNYTVRSHFSINGRLLDNKVVANNRQITGNVPAATLAEVGFVPVSVFGLFGEANDDASFQYTLPAPRTVGNEVVRTLRSYQDPTVRDPGT